MKASPRITIAASSNVSETPSKRPSSSSSRRALVLRTVAAPFALASVLNVGAADAPRLGVSSFNGVITGLTLCPSTPNCVGSADELNDQEHYIPAWTYVDPEAVARGKAADVSTSDAMKTLIDVVQNTDCAGYESKIVKQTDDYLRVTYTSPFWGFVDDVEFYFPADTKRVEYRSASRVGSSDFDANRKRVKTLRQALQRYGWRSVGFS